MTDMTVDAPGLTRVDAWISYLLGNKITQSLHAAWKLWRELGATVHCGAGGACKHASWPLRPDNSLACLLAAPSGKTMMNAVSRRGPCQEHGCYCQEFWPGLTTDDACDACDHDELFHRRWEVHEERADRRGYGGCRWAKVQKDDDGFAVIDANDNPVVLRSCKCTEFGQSRVDPGSGKCRACDHHRAFHKLLLGATHSVPGSVGVFASSLPHSSSVANTLPSAPPYEESVKEPISEAPLATARGKDKVSAVPPPAKDSPVVAAHLPGSSSSLVPRPWREALPGEALSSNLYALHV